MTIVRLIELFIAMIIAIKVIRGKAVYFPFFLLATGMFSFGGESGVGLNLSAFWLLFLWGMTFFVISKLRYKKFEDRTPDLENSLVYLFMFFLLFQTLRGTDVNYAIRMLLKLTYPYIVFIMARRAGRYLNRTEIYKCLEIVFLFSFVGFCLVGGFTQKFVPFVCWKSCAYVGLYGTGAMANHIAVMGVSSLAMWRVLKKTRYLVYCILAFISPVLVGVRTGIGAFVLGALAVVWVGFPRRISIPMIVLVPLIGLSAILFVPNVREHMFKDPDSIDNTGVLKNPGSISWDQIHNSGREFLWKLTLEELWESRPLLGSGLGATQEFMYREFPGGLNTVHSGYIEYLCDTGLVGLVGYFVVILVIMQRAACIYNNNCISSVRLLCLIVLGSFCAHLFCVGFTPTNSCVLPSTQYPFIFSGLLLGHTKRMSLDMSGE